MNDVDIGLLKGKLQLISDDIKMIIRKLYDFKEIGYQEYKTSSFIMKYLSERNFQTHENLAGIETAFKSVCYNGSGYSIGLIAEYDALPDIGHGCGHNLISAVMIGVLSLLSMMRSHWNGSVTIFGTPAEEGTVENAGSKILLLDRKAFTDIDLIVATHPGCKNIVGCNAINRAAIEISFFGKGGHAAFCVDKTSNISLMIDFLHMVNGNKNHFFGLGIEIQYVVNNCGIYPNIMPDQTSCKMYIRSIEENNLDTAIDYIKQLIEFVIKGTKTEYKMREYTNRYKSFYSLSSVDEIFEECFSKVVDKIFPLERPGKGSSDIGNISRKICTAHSFFSISEKHIDAHTLDFAHQTLAEEAFYGVNNAILAITSFCIKCFNDKNQIHKFNCELSNFK